MKTIFGRKSLLAIDNCEFVNERVIGGVVLISGNAFSRDRRKLWGRSQPRRAAHHGDALIAGTVLAKRKRYRAHGICQTTVLLLNLLMVGLVMWPSFQQQVRPALSRGLHKRYYKAGAIHATLGITVELLGLY